MKPSTSKSPSKLSIRTYACKASARRIKSGLQKLVESSPGFNESFLNGSFVEATRIGGLSQSGDIVVRHRTRRQRHELTVEHRAGDEALALEIESVFAKYLTLKAPRLASGRKRPEGMAYFLEMIRSSPLRLRVVVTDSAIEEAHDLSFDDYREARAKLEFLGMLSRLHTMIASLDDRVQRMYDEANTLHHAPRVCLHEGKKVRLPHRLHMVSRSRDFILTVHFAKLTCGRVLVGWVEERRF